GHRRGRTSVVDTMQPRWADRQGRGGHDRITRAHGSNRSRTVRASRRRAPAVARPGRRADLGFGSNSTSRSGGRYRRGDRRRDAASPPAIGFGSMLQALCSRRSSRRRRYLGVVLAASILTPSTAAAWHDDGHRIVGEIAERRLSEQTRARVRELLADMPEYDTLASAATWADQKAKLDPEFDFAFASHFVNVDRQLSPRELLALCLQKSGCVAVGVGYYAEILRSTRASKAQRAEALRFLIHFVGDAHQPLHAGHGGDRGGNDIDQLRLLEYTPGGERTNLHAVWDGGIVAITMTRAGWDWRRYAADLDRRIIDEKIARWGRGSAYD